MNQRTSAKSRSSGRAAALLVLPLAFALATGEQAHASSGDPGLIGSD